MCQLLHISLFNAAAVARTASTRPAVCHLSLPQPMTDTTRRFTQRHRGTFSKMNRYRRASSPLSIWLCRIRWFDGRDATPTRRVSRRLKAAGGDLSRRVLEALALDEYRLAHLSTGELRRLLGFSTGAALDGLLKTHGVSIDYTLEDLEQDRRDLSRVGFLMPGQRRSSLSPGHLRSLPTFRRFVVHQSPIHDAGEIGQRMLAEFAVGQDVRHAPSEQQQAVGD
jgi:Uncharacterised protein family (UPF0175)